MPFDVRAAADRLACDAAVPLQAPEGGWPAGAPEREYTRSPAAARVAHLAARDGLFLFHYEHNAARELPEDWVPLDRPELADPPRWEGGVLEERKYQGFRHDQPIGGFHPGHRAKWATHELCHSLVGHAWRADATRFFHATAGRLAELLPVVLWYFLDEVHLQRCPAHEDEGALFRAYCPACDAVAGPRVDDADAIRRLEDAKRFFDRELAAVARSRRLGRPVPHAWATIDLASDGVAYAGAHAARLGSEAFRHYAERFGGRGRWDSLDELEARVVAVARGVLGQGDPAPLAPSAAHGRARWRVQDVAWRLLTVWHETGGEVADELLALVDGLAEAATAGDPADAERALEAAIEGYAALHDAWVLPTPEEVFAVGYTLPRGHGSSVAQLVSGVRTATPLVAALLGDRLEKHVAAFAAADLAKPSRRALGERWAAFTTTDLGPVAADLARYEAALASPAPGDPVAIALGPQGADRRVLLAGGMRVLRFGVDVVAAAELAEAEGGALVGGDVRIGAGPVDRVDTALVIGRVDADVLVLDVADATATALEALGDGAISGLGADEEQSLRDLGVLVPAAWPETLTD